MKVNESGACDASMSQITMYVQRKARLPPGFQNNTTRLYYINVDTLSRSGMIITVLLTDFENVAYHVQGLVPGMDLAGKP